MILIKIIIYYIKNISVYLEIVFNIFIYQNSNDFYFLLFILSYINYINKNS
jgi:hypothetical protein